MNTRNKLIVHVSEVDIYPETGMGRVEYYWKNAFEMAGYTFLHIGPKEVGTLMHKAFFPHKAYKYYQRLKITPQAFIVHEPISGYFVNKGIPCFLESHGVERRIWISMINDSIPLANKQGVSLKTRLLYPLWRLRYCDLGMRRSNKLLLINSEDKEFVKEKYNRNDEDIFIFKKWSKFILF